MRTFITLGALLTALAVTLGQVEPRGARGFGSPCLQGEP
jgi:hypothetical protein